MAFDEIFPAKNAAAAKVPLRIGMSRMQAAPARMILLVQRDILARLGGRAERYRVHVGRSDDKHQMMLVQDDQGPFEANVAGQKSTVMRLRLPVMAQFPNCRIEPHAADFEIVAAPRRALIVTLPAWAWNPEAKKQREAAGR